LPGGQGHVLAYASYIGSARGIREIAFRQRAIMFCILGYLCAVALQFALPPEMRILAALLALPCMIAGAVFVFLLAIRVYGVALGIVFGVLTLVPCIGLIVLLIVNGKATTILKGAGLKVGLMGATVPPNFRE
jgi:hypothetical protein